MGITFGDSGRWISRGGGGGSLEEREEQRERSTWGDKEGKRGGARKEL